MGGITSKGFREMMDEEFPGMSTPPNPKRKMETQFDPRSPTCGIDRTPILVEKTPDTSLIDPRSPSIGIMRTPISSDKIVEHVIDPRSPTCGIDRTPIYTKPDDIDTDFSPIPYPDVLLDDEKPSPTKESSKPIKITTKRESLEDSIELMVKASPGSDIEEHSQLIKTPGSSAKKAQKTPKKTPTKDPLRLRRPKALFQGHTNSEASPKEGNQRSPLRLIGDSQRSPLSRKVAKDVNSPRAIVQRKQAHKLGMIKNQCAVQANQSPVKYQVFHDDKENSTSDM